MSSRQLKKDFEKSKSFVLTFLCAVGLIWIVLRAISYRDSLLFWIEWEKTALMATGITSGAFWLAAFFWPKQQWEYTNYKTAGTVVSFSFALAGSVFLFLAGWMATRHAEETKTVLESFASAAQMARTDAAPMDIKKMSGDFVLQSGFLAVGTLMLCFTQMMFLWGARNSSEEKAKRLRQDSRNCLLFSDGPCCIVFFIMFASLGHGAGLVSDPFLLTLYKVFLAGAVALQVTLSNIVYLLEFAEGPKRLWESFRSLIRLPKYIYRLMLDKS